MRPLSFANASAHFQPLAAVTAADAAAARVADAAPPSGNERANAAMERYARGDDAAFAAVYDAVAPRIHAYLIRQTRDRAAADDLLQKTLLQIHRKRGTYATGFAVLPWAYAIARRLCIDEFRRRKSDLLWSARELCDDFRLSGGAPDDDLAFCQLAEQVQAELSRMPETQRVAFELLRVEGLSHDEAAQVLGTTVSAVKLRAFRAYGAIRAVLGGKSERPSPSKPRRAV